MSTKVLKDPLLNRCLFTFVICVCANIQVAGQSVIDQSRAPSLTGTPTSMIADEQLAPSFVSLAIHWVVVPLILIIILIYGCTLPRRTTDPSVRTSGNAGIFAGFIVFVIFVVSQQKSGLRFSLDVPAYSFDLLGIAATVGGIVSGFVIALIVDAIKQYRAFGFLVLFIVATTTIASYGYFFIKDVRSLVVFMSLGVMLGALLHIICFPEAITKYNLSGESGEKAASGNKRSSTRSG